MKGPSHSLTTTRTAGNYDDVWGRRTGIHVHTLLRVAILCCLLWQTTAFTTKSGDFRAFRCHYRLWSNSFHPCLRAPRRDLSFRPTPNLCSALNVSDRAVATMMSIDQSSAIPFEPHHSNVAFHSLALLDAERRFRRRRHSKRVHTRCQVLYSKGNVLW